MQEYDLEQLVSLLQEYGTVYDQRAWSVKQRAAFAVVCEMVDNSFAHMVEDRDQ
jgi:hypothetical protein